MKADISSAPGWWDLRALVNTREARYRFFLCFAMGVLGQVRRLCRRLDFLELMYTVGWKRRRHPILPGDARGRRRI